MNQPQDASPSNGDATFAPVCRAPFVSMYFEASGRVTACGANQTMLLGRVGEASLRSMWEGAVAQRLRQALAQDDLGLGCERCRDHLDAGNRSGALAASFDHFVAEPDPAWPRRLELAMSTRCNLQCVMCSGEFSSSIRAHREHLPPLPPRYGDAFFEELRPFLHHVEQVRFLGGEPFLAEESFRVWDLMVEEGVQPESNVTTNGTRYTPRVARVLERLPFSIGVSIDGVRPDTVERIRAGASHAEIMQNVLRFREHTRAWGTSLSLTFCLMVSNWRELGDYLLLGERLGCRVYLNTVHQPPAESLYRLPLHKLDKVIHALERQGESLVEQLDENLEVWLGQLARLGHHRELLRVQGPPSPAGPWLDLLDAVVACGPDPDAIAVLLDEDPRLGVAGELVCDVNDEIESTRVYAGLDEQELVGRPVSVLRDLLLRRYGPRAEVVADRQDHGVTVRVIELGDPQRPITMVTATFTDRAAGRRGSRRVSAMGGGAPVTVGLSPGRRPR